MSSHSSSKFPQWMPHANHRKKERNISVDTSKITLDYITKLPFYTNGECYHYCDVNEGVIYYVRENKIVTIIKTNPIAMLRKICMIREIDFNCVCRDNIFGNCKRGNHCRYIHIEM